MYPWRDWNEWNHVYHLLFKEMGIVKNHSFEREVDLLTVKAEDNLKKAMNIITVWLLRNVGGDSSKYLKMQKLLLVQTLSLRRALSH